MEFKEIRSNNISHYFPWKISTSELQPNILLMCKMLIILLLFNGFYFKINDPFLPFIRWFDFFNEYPGIFKNTLRFGFIFFCLMLMINIKTKWSSFVLGIIIILTLLASKPVFRNHLFIVGGVLFLVGLSKPKGLPWLIILQISLVYIGASLNKALQIDWWTGIFMHNWLVEAIENPIYIFISSLLPNLWFAKILSWSSIFVELIIGLAILTKKWRLIGIWMMIIFHFAMFTMLAFRFGHFVQDLFIILIAFLAWPQEKVVVKQYKNSKLLKNLIRFLDWDNLYIWEKDTKEINSNFESENNEIKDSESKSLVFLLLYTEGFYIFLFIYDYLTMKLIYAVEPLLAKILVHLVFCLVIWYLILLFFTNNLKTKSLIFSLTKKQ